jgi:hypothetical protein
MTPVVLLELVELPPSLTPPESPPVSFSAVFASLVDSDEASELEASVFEEKEPPPEDPVDEPLLVTLELGGISVGVLGSGTIAVMCTELLADITSVSK